MISKLHMRNFRRFEDEILEFTDGISFIEGRNNAGKTTIFMAIEYALFGTVSGFRSQAALIQPEKDKMGVEILYEGKTGKVYKLQRMHELRGRSRKRATGHYTLKEIRKDGEKYLISSDFEDGSEEMLQLQIFETLGISKRLFDVAIHIKQGQITSILEGDKHLDIVLGVSAAVMAKKQLNKVALGFEKETSQYETLKATIDGYRKELQELKNQKTTLQDEIEEIKIRINSFEDKLEMTETNKSQLQPVMGCFNEFKQSCRNWDKIHDKLQDQYRRYKKLVSDAGKSHEITARIEHLQEEIQEKEKTQDRIEKDKQILLDKLRQLEQKMGDLKGKIKRRKSLSTGDATCEVCGAVINQERVRKELDQWQQEQVYVQDDIVSAESRIEEMDISLKKIQEELREVSAEISEKEGALKQLQEAKEETNELEEALAERNEDLLDKAIALYDELQEYNSQQDKEGTITIAKPKLLDLDSVVDLDEDVITARSMIPVYNDKLIQEQEQLRQSHQKVSVELKVLQDQLKDRNLQKKRLKPRIQTINQEIAKTKEKIEELRQKRDAAERMRTSAKIFKTLQEALRDRAATTLAKKTLQFHELLAGNTEYDDLSVDPKNYRIYVKPDDIGEEVPAHSYQGGGHKLLLGIAFKLAIIDLVTKPPFILLDEPTYGLDTVHKSKLFDKVNQLTTSQLLLITHQRENREMNGKFLHVKKEGATSTVEVIR